jgi:hypothetical protein
MFYLMMLVAAQDYTAFKSRMIGEIWSEKDLSICLKKSRKPQET